MGKREKIPSTEANVQPDDDNHRAVTPATTGDVPPQDVVTLPGAVPMRNNTRMGRNSKIGGGSNGTSKAPIPSVGSSVGFNNSSVSLRGSSHHNSTKISNKVSTRGLKIPAGSSHTTQSRTSIRSAATTTSTAQSHSRGLRRTQEELDEKRDKRTGGARTSDASSPGGGAAPRVETVINPNTGMDVKMATFNLTPHPNASSSNNNGDDSSNPPPPPPPPTDLEEGGTNLPYPTGTQIVPPDHQPIDRDTHSNADGNGGHGQLLAVADPVNGSSILLNLEEAKEVNPTKGLSPEQKKTRDFKRNILLAFIVLAGIITLAVVLTIDTASDSEEDDMILFASNEKTSTPTMPPTTGVPTMAPTTLLGIDLPPTTQDAVTNHPLSAQAKAYHWLSNHGSLPNLPTWRKQQLFALAAFYYSLDGPNWPDITQRSWLDDTVHECNWFSKEFLDSEVEYYLGEAVGSSSNNNDNNNNIDTEICTPEGRYTTLALSLLNLPNPKDNHDDDSFAMPEEIGWLSSLESFRIDISNVKANLSDLLLSQQQDKPILPSNVTSVSLFANNIFGSIPSEIAKMTALNYLDLSKNELGGSIPTVFGTLTSLGEIYLQENTIGGSLPSELGSLGGVHRMDLSRNLLTSTLPTEINAMTSLEWLWIRHNHLEGSLSGSDLGGLTNLIGLYLQNNSLTGPLDHLITPEWAKTHSPLMRYLHLASNDFSGSTIPTEIGLMSNLKQLNLSHAGLTGTIPSELGLLNASNNQICLLGNNFEGELPMELCPWICMDVTSPFTIQEFMETSSLVASDRCNCTLGKTYPLENVTNELVINVRFDEYPDETEWFLEKLVITLPSEEEEFTNMEEISMDNNTTNWVTVDTELGVPEQICQLVSYNHNVTSNTLYRFHVTDAFGDGNCCNHGLGGISITNSTIASSMSDDDDDDDDDQEYNPYKGTIVWNSWDAGFADFVETYLWVDANGQTSVVSIGEGFDLAKAAAAAVAQTSTISVAATKDGNGRA